MATTTPIYQDFDLNFAIHPVRKDLVLLRDESAVTGALMHLLMLNHFEIPFHPEIGCNIRKLLFENLTPFVAEDLTRFIRETITNFEPRARIDRLIVIPDYENNGYGVDIRCFIGINPAAQSLKFLLERIR